jgi:regulator of RNase E activity RraA
MRNDEIRSRFESLSTANIVDGCLRVGVTARCAPAGIHSALPGYRLAGAVRPAIHAGSVDVFLEAFELAAAGDILVVDNGGVADESCVGDLVALEAQAAGLGGIVIWGLHRDTPDLAVIALPIFSFGSISTGPLSARERVPAALESARVGEWTVNASDIAFGDEDGVIFVAADRLDAVLDAADGIHRTESAQAERIRSGVSLREQVEFGSYLAKRSANPTLTFREHLQSVGGEIEV